VACNQTRGVSKAAHAVAADMGIVLNVADFFVGSLKSAFSRLIMNMWVIHKNKVVDGSHLPEYNIVFDLDDNCLLRDIDLKVSSCDFILPQFLGDRNYSSGENNTFR